jgi:hypothetical protein
MTTFHVTNLITSLAHGVVLPLRFQIAAVVLFFAGAAILAVHAYTLRQLATGSSPSENSSDHVHCSILGGPRSEEIRRLILGVKSPTGKCGA